MSARFELKVGDVAVMRKPHACGSLEWEIVRVGADIGIRCLGCKRRVLLERSYFLGKLIRIRPSDGSNTDSAAN